MIARGIRTLALATAGVFGVTAAGSLLIGVAAGYSALRSLSAGLVLVGAILFVAGGLTSFRSPRRGRSSVESREHGGNETFALSLLLVTGGLLFVILGIALDPETTL